jgi:hypothetical protein
VAVTVLEPTAALEGDGRGGDDALQQSAAVRADGDFRVGELLDMFRVFFAFLAFVLVKRHDCFL